MCRRVAVGVDIHGDQLPLRWTHGPHASILAVNQRFCSVEGGQPASQPSQLQPTPCPLSPLSSRPPRRTAPQPHRTRLSGKRRVAFAFSCQWGGGVCHACSARLASALVRGRPFNFLARAARVYRNIGFVLQEGRPTVTVSVLYFSKILVYLAACSPPARRLLAAC